MNDKWDDKQASQSTSQSEKINTLRHVQCHQWPDLPEGLVFKHSYLHFLQLYMIISTCLSTIFILLSSRPWHLGTKSWCCCSLLPTFLKICLSRDLNKWLHTKQNEWIYTLKYVYIHPYVVVHLKSLKRQICRNEGVVEKPHLEVVQFKSMSIGYPKLQQYIIYVHTEERLLDADCLL